MAAAPQVDWSTVGQGAPGQITTTGPQVDWSSVGQAPTSTTPNVPAPQPSGGGGIGGWLTRQVKTAGALVNPVNMAKGVGRLGKDVVRGAVDTGEKVINTAGSELGANPNIGGDAYARSTSWLPGQSGAQAELNDLPAISGTMGGIKQTLGHIAGNAQFMANIPHYALSALPGGALGLAKATANPLGQGFEHQTLHDYATNPIGSGVNDAANIAAVLGAAGDAAGAGDVMKPLPEGVEGPVAPATGLQSLGQTLKAASEGVGRVGNPLGVLGPIAHGIDLPIGENGLHVPGLADTPIGTGVKGALGRAGAHAKAGALLRNMRNESGTNIFDTDREAQDILKGITSDKNEHAAALLRQQGMEPLMQELTSHAEGEHPIVTAAKTQALNQILDQLGSTMDERPTEEAAHLAARPNDTVIAAQHALDSVRAIREQQNLAGVGSEPGHGPLNPNQLVAEPLPRSQYPKALQKTLDRLEAEKNQRVGTANTLSDRAARLQEAAQQEETVARGNTGQAAEEAAAARNQRAQAQLGNLKGKSASALQALHDLAIERANPEADVNVQVGHVQDEVRQQAENMDTARRALAAMGMDPISRENMIRQVMPPLPKINDMRAEALARAKAALPNEESIAQTEVAAGSNAAVHVRDALHTDAEAADAGLRKTQGNTFGANNDLGPSRPGYDSLSTHEKALYREAVGEDYANKTGAQLEAARDKVIDRLSGRGLTAGRKEGFRSGVAAVADKAAKVAVRRATASISRLDDALETARNSPAGAPAQFRTSLQVVRDAMGTIAEAASRDDIPPAVAADLGKIQGELDKYSHLDYWKGREPEIGHVIQPSTNDVERTVKGQNLGSGGGGKYATNKAGRTRVGVASTYSQKGYAALEHSHEQTLAHNEFIKMVDNRLAKSVKDVIGPTRDMTGEQIRGQLEANGVRGWAPTAKLRTQLEPGLEQLNDNTRVLPVPVHDELGRYYQHEVEPQNKMALGLSHVGPVLDKATGLIYRSTLGISPSFLLKRTMGNALVMWANGMKISDMPSLFTEAMGKVHDGEVPALFDLHANDNPGRIGKFQRGAQYLPRMVDKMSKTMEMLDQERKGASHEAAVANALSAMGDYGNLSDVEKSVVSRVFPIYPWTKAVTAALGKVATDKPAVALWALHMGNLAADNPQAFSQSYAAQQFNPTSIFSGQPGAFVNPLLRGPAALAGFNLSNWKPETNPTGNYQTAFNGNSAGQDLYQIADQLPLGKLALQTPITPSGLHSLGQPLNQNDARYNTGDLREYKGQPEQSFTPGVKTPLGTFGPYFRSFVGLPETPRVPASAKNAIAKKAKSTAKTESTRSRAIKALNKRGVH